MNPDELAELLESGRRPGAPGTPAPPGPEGVRDLLADEGMWAEPAPGGLDALLATIEAESAARPAGPRPEPPTPGPSDAGADTAAAGPWPEPPTPGPSEAGTGMVGPTAERPGTVPPGAAGPAGTPLHLAGRSRRPRGRAVLVAVAAAVLVVAAGVAGLLLVSDREGGGYDVALSGGELAPDASATGTVEDTPSGVSISLDVRGLPPAEPGTYYQAWVKSPDDQLVTVGTFHVRGGDDRVELWSGVEVEDYPLLTVTLQQEGGGQESSGQLVLSGRVAP